VKLSSWPEIGSDGDVLLMPYVPKGTTGYDDDETTKSSRGSRVISALVVIIMSCFTRKQEPIGQEKG